MEGGILSFMHDFSLVTQLTSENIHLRVEDVLISASSLFETVVVIKRQKLTLIAWCNTNPKHI